MVDRAPDFTNGDLVTAFEHSIVETFKATATMNKGDVVSFDSTGLVGQDLAGIALGTVQTAISTVPLFTSNTVGVITGTQTGTTAFASGDYVPVILLGITKCTATAAAIVAGASVTYGSGASGSHLIIQVAAGAATDADHRSYIDNRFGYAISAFGSSDSGYVMVSH